MQYAAAYDIMNSMTWQLILEIFLIGVSLAMDALAVSVTDGLCYNNLNKRKGVLIPLTFGLFQAVMPLIGFFVAYGFGLAFREVFDTFDHWIAFALLFVIGAKMIFDAIKEFRSPSEGSCGKNFSITEVLIQGVATSIDALFIGVSFVAYDALKNTVWYVFIAVAIIGVTTFLISLAGLLLGVKFGNILKKKAGLTNLIGGLVLIGIGLKILIEGLI